RFAPLPQRDLWGLNEPGLNLRSESTWGILPTPRVLPPPNDADALHCGISVPSMSAMGLGCSLIPGVGSSSPRTSLPGTGFSPRCRHAMTKWPHHPNLRKKPHAPSKGRGPVQRAIRRVFMASGAEVLDSSVIYEWAHRR